MMKWQIYDPLLFINWSTNWLDVLWLRFANLCYQYYHLLHTMIKIG